MYVDEAKQTSWFMKVAGIAIAIVAAVLLFGTWWTGDSARQATEDAVRSVSLFYLDELAGRREQVVATNLQNSIEDLENAISLMTEDDLADKEHLEAFQTRMKQIYSLERLAFVGADGLIYTSTGIEEGIENYHFDPNTISEPKISVYGLETPEKKVIIAIPLDDIPFQDDTLVAAFMQIDMQELVAGLSLQSDANDTTFCNLYTVDGVSLTNMVLGGLASEDNLLDALSHAQFETGYSFEQIQKDFKDQQQGIASFDYNGIQETLAYIPVEGTDWMLTYLIRESVIAEQTSAISDGIMTRNLAQMLITLLALLAVFAIIFSQFRRSARIDLERQTFEAETRTKQESMEEQLALQEQLLEQERQRAEQDHMITALASDYRGVYYVDLDTDEGVCYQADATLENHLEEGEHFAFHPRFTAYADKYVAEDFREGFLKFVDPTSIRAALEEEPVITYRYLVTRDGRETYEMLRMAGVGQDEGHDGIHAVGLGFADVDRETRESMARSQALSDALAVAEDANKAKTAFLSNMSHEIRTPMNAIIGLDSIALNDPGLSARTREHLEKIGDSARHLLGLINDILDVSRIESGRMTLNNERFSFSKLLEQVNTIISSQCNDKGLEYGCRILSEVDDHYIGDDMKLRQSLINILGNAVKFTPEGGKVDFTIERIAQYEGHSTLRFVIADTGIGMDADFIPRIFDTFSQEDSSRTSKYGSTGLGLAITKSIIEMMNGDIEVASQKGVGSTFTVTVTLKNSERIGADDGEEQEIDPKAMSVLIVDDDPVACEHAKLVLEAVGIGAQIAQSGAEAIEMVRLREARRDPYNLILVDWKMPEMDGVETTRRIRAIVGDQSAIIILTAYNWDDVLEEALQAGVDSFIAKPLFASNVIDEFRQALKRKNVFVTHEAHRADLAGRRILLAEDMLINAEIMKELMKMRDVTVEHAENGRIAVDMFAGHPAGYYDAILMDMRMPEMDGLTATTTIRNLEGRPDAKEIPIIALTANAFDEDVQQSLQAGLNAHLSKPVEADTLFDTLELLIKD
ncbi:MAG: response regulator [Coriobacteriaceae bacterium]|nr:response regulator [Coriobacteriaceae bacterium]